MICAPSAKPVRTAMYKAVDWVVLKAQSLYGKGKAVVKKGVAKLMAWWNAKEEFTTEQNKKHKLFFEGEGRKARLMIASDEQPFEEFLNDQKNQPKNKKDTVRKKAISRAKKIWEVVKKRTQKEEVGQTKEEVDQTMNSNNTDELQRKFLEKKMKKLVKAIKIFYQRNNNTIPSTPPIYGSLSSGGGFGTFVRVPILSKDAGGKGNAHTSSPRGSKTGSETYKILEQRQEKISANKTIYRKGHLLQNHYGPGKNWKYLTTIQDSANRLMSTLESKIEPFINKGVELDFQITVTYGRKPPDTGTETFNKHYNAYSNKVGLGAAGQQAYKQAYKDKWEEIRKAEAHVPKSIQYHLKNLDQYYSPNPEAEKAWAAVASQMRDTNNKSGLQNVEIKDNQPYLIKKITPIKKQEGKNVNKPLKKFNGGQAPSEFAIHTFLGAILDKKVNRQHVVAQLVAKAWEKDGPDCAKAIQNSIEGRSRINQQLAWAQQALQLLNALESY